MLVIAEVFVALLVLCNHCYLTFSGMGVDNGATLFSIIIFVDRLIRQSKNKKIKILFQVTESNGKWQQIEHVLEVGGISLDAMVLFMAKMY